MALEAGVEGELHAGRGVGAMDFCQELKGGEVVGFEVESLAAEALGFALFAAAVGFPGVAVDVGDVG